MSVACFCLAVFTENFPLSVVKEIAHEGGAGGGGRGGGVEATKMGVEENLQATLVSAAVCGVRQSVEDCEKSCFSTTGDESITFNLSIFNKKR